MSEQQTATVPTASRNEPDTSEPDATRQAELRAAYKANVAAAKPPYDKVWIRTLGEVNWILREHDWSGEEDLPVGKHRPDLRGTSLVSADVSGTSLFSADLSSADLTAAILSGTDLIGANLSGAIIEDASLSGANLRGADLSKAGLTNADLSGADLRMATLSGANLRIATLSGTSLVGADLSGANLTSARMDGATTLNGVTLDGNTRLGDVRWNGVPLTQVSIWPSRLGDEQAVTPARNRKDRTIAYRNAARAYRSLSIVLRSQGMLDDASKYRLREQVLERKATFLSGNLLGWAFSWLLNLVAGYGERPRRAFFAYLLVLIGFAGVYFALGSGALGIIGLGVHDEVNTPLAAIVFSVTSFHGRGFFPSGNVRHDDPIIVLATVEAVIGLFIEITFIATFTQRFLGGR